MPKARTLLQQIAANPTIPITMMPVLGLLEQLDSFWQEAVLVEPVGLCKLPGEKKMRCNVCRFFLLDLYRYQMLKG